MLSAIVSGAFAAGGAYAAVRVQLLHLRDGYADHEARLRLLERALEARLGLLESALEVQRRCRIVEARCA